MRLPKNPNLVTYRKGNSRARLQKWCWLARETRAGWRLTFCADRDHAVRGLLLGSEDDVKRVTGDAPTVFVHLSERTLHKAA